LRKCLREPNRKNFKEVIEKTMNSIARENAFEDQIGRILRSGSIENYKIR
jgi:hypothetical protein